MKVGYANIEKKRKRGRKHTTNRRELTETGCGWEAIGGKKNRTQRRCCGIRSTQPRGNILAWVVPNRLGTRRCRGTEQRHPTWPRRMRKKGEVKEKKIAGAQINAWTTKKKQESVLGTYRGTRRMRKLRRWAVWRSHVWGGKKGGRKRGKIPNQQGGLSQPVTEDYGQTTEGIGGELRCDRTGESDQ